MANVKSDSLPGGREVKYLPDLMLDGHWRVIWHSLEARESWQPLIEELRLFSRELQVAAVRSGLREAALVSVEAAEFTDFSRELTESGLACLPLGSRRENLGLISPAWFRLGTETEKMTLVVARGIELAREIKRSLEDDAARTAGKLLGYPGCCLDFYVRRTSVEKIDPLWFVFENSPLDYEEQAECRFYEITDDVPAEIFSPFRYLGINSIPYYPCSIECEKTQVYLDDYEELARSLSDGHYAAFRHMHRWPLKWSCLKGIVYLSTPVFDLEATSLPVYPELLMHKRGSEYPRAGVEGLEFPWNVELDEVSVEVKNFEEEMIQ